jgi:uncharacterized protein YjbI with pentapeptide repeats
MGQITIRRTSVNLPLFLEEAELTRVSSLGSGGGLVSGFEFADVSTRALDVRDVRLLDGKIHAVRAEAASMTGARLQSVEFTRCDLGSLRWSGGKVSRTRLDSCRLLGARFENMTLEHVVFTDCKMDYATLAHIRTSGPVMFIRCSLREADFTSCDLAGSLFYECDLVLANFGKGKYAGCDLRGNDLSAVNGAHNLKRVVVDRAQLLQLAEALAAELEVSFGDDLDDPQG